MRDDVWRDTIYRELRALAAAKMAAEAPGATLSPTALVHEAYLRLMSNPAREGRGDASKSPPPLRAGFADRAEFFAAAATAMRRILVDRARQRRAQKRGGGRDRADLAPEQLAAPERSEDLLALDEALQRFAELEPRKAKLVELRYFAGLTLEQAADALGISPATADRDWAFARAWLFRELDNR